MPISVTNSGADILLDDGNPIYVPKNRARVSSRGDIVRIQWSSTEYVEANYANFTAPTGATAVAVRDAVEAFLDTGGAFTLAANSGVDIGDVDILSIAGGTNNIGITGRNLSASVTIIRASNTTAYAINDVMNAGTDTTPLAFTIARANDLRGWIVGGTCVSNANQSTLPNIDLLLYSSTFTIAADNLAFAPTFAQYQTYLGKIRFSTWVARGVRSESDGSVEQSFIFVPASGTQIIYAVPVMQNAYTPISAENLQFTINGEQY